MGRLQDDPAVLCVARSSLTCIGRLVEWMFHDFTASDGLVHAAAPWRGLICGQIAKVDSGFWLPAHCPGRLLLADTVIQ